MPSPNELKVLRIAKEEEEINKFRLSRRMEITTEYSDYLLRSLTRRDYLVKVAPGKYSLTPKGGEALVDVLYQMEGRLTAKIRWCSHLRNRVNERIKNELKDHLAGKKQEERR